MAFSVWFHGDSGNGTLRNEEWAKPWMSEWEKAVEHGEAAHEEVVSKGFRIFKWGIFSDWWLFLSRDENQFLTWVPGRTASGITFAWICWGEKKWKTPSEPHKDQNQSHTLPQVSERAWWSGPLAPASGNWDPFVPSCKHASRIAPLPLSPFWQGDRLGERRWPLRLQLQRGGSEEGRWAIPCRIKYAYEIRLHNHKNLDWF